MTRDEFEQFITSEVTFARLTADARKHGAGLDVEEIVQDILEAACRAFPSFRGECNPYTWLHEILRKKILDRLRRQKCERAVEEALSLAGQPGTRPRRAASLEEYDGVSRADDAEGEVSFYDEDEAIRGLDAKEEEKRRRDLARRTKAAVAVRAYWSPPTPPTPLERLEGAEIDDALDAMRADAQLVIEALAVLGLIRARTRHKGRLPRVPIAPPVIYSRTPRGRRPKPKSRIQHF